MVDVEIFRWIVAQDVFTKGPKGVSGYVRCYCTNAQIEEVPDEIEERQEMTMDERTRERSG